MAELFKPEIREIGGTNVTVYSPPSMDYSGVIASFGNILDTVGRERKGPTEGEIKTAKLAEIGATLARINEIEDPTRKAVEFKLSRMKALATYSDLRDEINELYSDFSGEVYQATGKPLEEIEQANTYKWVSDTTEGKAAASYAYVSTNGNQEEADLIIRQQYMLATQRDLAIDEAKKASERTQRDEQARKADFAARVRPILQKSVSDAYAMDTSQENIAIMTQEARSKNIEPTVYMLDVLKATKEQRLAEVTTKINKSGLDASTEKPETLVTEYDATIKSMEANLDLLIRSTKNKTDNEIAQMLSNGNFSPITKRMWLNNDPNAFAFALNSNPKLQKENEILAEMSVGPFSPNMAADAPSSNLSPGTATDSGTEFANRYPNLANREELMKIFNAKPAWTSVVTIGKDRANSYKLGNESPEMTEATHRALSTMYVVALPEIDRALNSIKSYSVKALLSDKMLAIANDMSTTLPVKGKDLYNKMNNYAANSANILINNFNTNMDTIKNTEEIPFKLQMDKNGVVSLGLNEVAVRKDPTLKKAMGAYRYETKTVGRGSRTSAIEQLPTETDPIKILSNYVSIMDYTNQDEIIDIVKALNTLSLQSRKIPTDARVGVDATEVLRMGIEEIK